MQPDLPQPGIQSAVSGPDTQPAGNPAAPEPQFGAGGLTFSPDFGAPTPGVQPNQFPSTEAPATPAAPAAPSTEAPVPTQEQTAATNTVTEKQENEPADPITEDTMNFLNKLSEVAKGQEFVDLASSALSFAQKYADSKNKPH